MTGSVVTFYSYKGGVGRTFALANVATMLATWGFKVLMVDWDIEAPGLSHYFDFSPPGDNGVIDFLRDCNRLEVKPWEEYRHPISLPGARGSLWLMPAAGRRGRNYARSVQHLDWDELFGDYQLGTLLEQMRAEWVSTFDFILVDSRTGITDFSGITTVQLPDTLVFLFTANNQSLDGCIDVVRRATQGRREFSIDRPALRAVPIPSKFEMREEYDRAKAWRLKFSKRLSHCLDDWVPIGVDHSSVLDHLSVPYVPRWTFGEEVAALQEMPVKGGLRSPSYQATYALETVSALIAHRFERVELLYSSRDEFVLAAQQAAIERRAPKRDQPLVFLSYARKDREISSQLAAILEQSGFDVWWDANLVPGDQWLETINAKLEETDALLVLFGSERSRFQTSELEHYLRSSLRSDVSRPLVPLVLPDGEKSFLSSHAAQYQALRLEPEQDLARQLQQLVTRLKAQLDEPK